MVGTSRESLTGLRATVDARRSEPTFAAAAAELFSVCALVSWEKALRSTLADAGQPSQVRADLARSLFGSRLGATAAAIVVDVATSRWSHDADLVEALESLAAQVAFTTAQEQGVLDRVEDELFRIGRAIDASAELQLALTDPALPAQARTDIITTLLRDRAHPITVQVVSATVSDLRGRRLGQAIDALVELAASQRQRVVATVHAAIDLSPAQRERLMATLSTMTGRQVHVNVVVDPAVIGGASVRLGDEIVDGTIATRLEQARRALVAD